MPSDDVRIRPYRPSDRAAVRRICYDTAHQGSSMQGILEDRDVLADCVTRYYTDVEPQSTWVAESADRVVGYVTGCLDSRRYMRLMCWRIVPTACVQAVLRGTLCSGTTWRFLRAGLGTWLRGGWRRRVPLSRYPAHLHMNLEPACRRRGIGGQLLARFCQQAQSAGLAGVHAVVNGRNAAARRFFERQGFVLVSEHPVGSTCVYGKTL